MPHSPEPNPFADIEALAASVPPGSDAAVAVVGAREVLLTKPAGSLGRLENLVAFLAR